MDSGLRHIRRQYLKNRLSNGDWFFRYLVLTGAIKVEFKWSKNSKGLNDPTLPVILKETKVIYHPTTLVMIILIFVAAIVVFIYGSVFDFVRKFSRELVELFSGKIKDFLVEEIEMDYKNKDKYLKL